MLSQDDIDAFKADNEAALAAADEYKRRAEKGLPADRFADGTEGAYLVAQGIAAYQWIVSVQATGMLNMLDAAKQAGTDAMRLHSQDSKYK